MSFVVVSLKCSTEEIFELYLQGWLRVFHGQILQMRKLGSSDVDSMPTQSLIPNNHNNVITIGLIQLGCKLILQCYW
jgi:hypothetical protein